MAGLNTVAPIYETDEGETGLYLPDRSPKRDMRSKLLRSKEAAAGLIVNACPFGCKEKDLDAQQYCRHMIGTTDPDDETIYFPLKLRGAPKKNTIPFRFTDGSDPQMVEPDQRLVKISDAAGSRVYSPNPTVLIYVNPDAPKPVTPTA